ncbi:MAG: GNAT family N-acetyltransferase [Anaerolineae bacterium]
MQQLNSLRLVRRPAREATDMDLLTAMQSESYAINFPEQVFSEHLFRPWLGSGIRRGEIWIYTLDGEVVGWLWLDLKRPRRSAHIVHVQVATEHWGRGIGRRIVEDGIAQARDAGRKKLTLTVTKSNARAMTLYAHLGFAVTGDLGDRQMMLLEL